MSYFLPSTVTETDHSLPIHREAPAFVEQATEQQILVTGIKVSYPSFSCSDLLILSIHSGRKSKHHKIILIFFVLIDLTIVEPCDVF